jgi:hypothetical protein
MYGGWRLALGLVAGLVSCLVAAPGLAWLAIVGGIVVTAKVGALAGIRASGRRRAAIDGGWAGAIAAGVAWIGGVGVAVGVRASAPVMAMAEAGTKPEDGDRILAVWVAELATAAPLVFWALLVSGAVVGAVAGAAVGGRGTDRGPRLPMSVAPALLLLGAAFGYLVVQTALAFLAPNMSFHVSESVMDTMGAVQRGSAACAVALFAGWTGWSAGFRVRHSSYAIRTSGALLAGFGVLTLAVFVLWGGFTNPAGFAGIVCCAAFAAIVGMVASAAGFVGARGTEPTPALTDGVSEVLHAGLLGVSVGFGGLGASTALITSVLVVTQIPALVGSAPWDGVPSLEGLAAGFRWGHASIGVQALLGTWAVLAVFVFPSIAAQRWFTRKG